EDFRTSEKCIEIVGMNLSRLLLSTCDLSSNLSAHRRDLPFKTSQARFLGVLVDHHAERIVGEVDLTLRQAVFFNLFGYEMPLGNLELFLLGITAELNDLHAIAERRLNGIQHVRGGYEHHVGEIECDAEVIVAECEVLLGSENLEKRG